MTTIPCADNARPSRHTFLFFLALIAVGLAGNSLRFSILNADFIFGSIFAMLALQFLGFGRGIVAAAIISSYTYLAWNHPYAILTMTAEVAVVGWLISHRKINLVAADALYWVAIGIPIGYLCFHLVSHLPTSNSMFLMTKQAINGIANCMVARLIFIGYSLRSKASLISLREIVSNLLTFFALCTGLIMLTVGSRADFAETDHRVRTRMIQGTREVTNSLENWLEDRELPIVNLARMASTISPGQMQTSLDQAQTSDKNFLRMALVDKEATAIAYSPLVDELGQSTIGKRFGDRPYIPELKQKLQPMLSEVIVSRFGRPDPVAIMLAPVISRGEYGGYVAGILNLDRIRNILEINSIGQGMHYTLRDRNGNVIITSREDQKAMTPFLRSKGMLNRRDEEISQWIPELPPNTSTIELWGKSFYVVESAIGKLAEWKLILERPMAPFQKMLYDRYTVRFFMLFLVVLVLLALAEFLSRRMVSATEQLGIMTIDLPAKLTSQGPVMWPESSMLETNHLIRNFREMADSLLAKFNENRQINESLEQLVKERTHELKKSQEKLFTAMEIAHLGHWDYDIATDLFTFNDHFYKLFRTTAKQVGGYTMSSVQYARRFVHPDDIPIVAAEIQQAAESTDPHYSRQLEHRMLYADGTVGHIIVRFEIVQDAHGRTVKTYGVNQDITESKQAEEALRQSEEKYRTLFEESLDALFMVTEDGTLIDANKSYFELLGYEKEEILGHSVIKTYADPADRPRYHEALLTKGFVKDYPLTLVRKDGQQLDCVVSARIERDNDGNILICRGFIRDTTEQKNLQRQLLQAQKMEAIGTLAGGIAHDFNNLLTVVLGFSELLLDEKDEKHPEYADLQKIFHAASNGAELVQRLLMFSRKSEPKPVPMNLNRQVLEVEKLLRRTIPKMIDIKLELSADLPQINADPSQVEQVLMNLAVNARDAMPDPGTLTVRTDTVSLDEEYCRLHVEATPGRYVVLEVGDTGHGMNKETVEHIFEPFFTTKEMGQGTGLGLAMVYGIVAQHNGHISVYSEVGRGTIFKVYFPALLAETEKEAEESGIMPAFGTETVLLVDDEEFVRDLGARILMKHGYTVLRAVNGSEALDLFEKERARISLVILDLIMPEMGGTECLKELLEIDPKVKILIASGFSADASVKETIQMGAKGFVSKPFRVKKLLEDVRKVLDEG